MNYRFPDNIQRLCCNGARSPEATNTWPRVTENIFQVVRPGDGFLIYSQKARLSKKALRLILIITRS